MNLISSYIPNDIRPSLAGQWSAGSDSVYLTLGSNTYRLSRASHFRFTTTFRGVTSGVHLALY